jgi:hypothetical protein
MFIGLPTKIGKIFSWAPRPTKISSIFVCHSQTDEHKSIIFVGLSEADENSGLLIGLSLLSLSRSSRTSYLRRSPPALCLRAAIATSGPPSPQRRPPSSLAATPQRRPPSSLAVTRRCRAARPSLCAPAALHRRSGVETGRYGRTLIYITILSSLNITRCEQKS